MAEPIIEMRDLVGPYKGQIRPYLKHAAEHAAASGFAEYVTDEPEAEAVPAPELEADRQAETEPRALPEDFPGRAALIAAGFATVEAVRGLGDPTTVPGIGAATARRLAQRLAELG